jgi:crotonobetainyl-CoA:carnitine CoA-transferase CaiB-like acyl-CoA transferase
VPGPLDGIRVVELGVVIAGPATAAVSPTGAPTS